MSDWLDIEPEDETTSNLPALVVLPDDYSKRLEVVEACWAALTTTQKTFLSALRDCRLNSRAAARLSGLSRGTHTVGMRQKNYSTVVRAWRASVAASALDRDRLLARQEDIVETLLTPKPILYQGNHTGFEEIDASAASKANEVLLDRVMPKRPDVEVNVGVAYVPETIEIEQSSGTVIDATAEVVEATPAFPPDEDWIYEVSSDSGEVLRR